MYQGLWQHTDRLAGRRWIGGWIGGWRYFQRERLYETDIKGNREP